MKHYKEFNAEHARAGAPYYCLDETEATVLKWDRRDRRVPSYPLGGVVGDEDQLISWTLDGRYAHSNPGHPRTLVMTPLGMVDGKPVFVGDDLVDDLGQPFTAHPQHREFSGCTWPKPAKVYPVTRLTDMELANAFMRDPTEHRLKVMRDGTNAALKHAIDAGQVLLPCQEVKQALLLLDYMAEDQGNLAMSGDNLKDWRAIHAAALAGAGVTEEPTC